MGAKPTSAPAQAAKRSKPTEDVQLHNHVMSPSAAWGAGTGSKRQKSSENGTPSTVITSSTSATTPETNSKYQRLIENAPLTSLPADEFLNKIKLFSGPEICIYCGGQEFRVSKALLCYSSSFFKSKLEGVGTGTEGEHKLIIDGHHSAEAFSLVVQWMFQGHITLPERVEDLKVESTLVPSNPKSEKSAPDKGKVDVDINVEALEFQYGPLTVAKRKISRYLDFLVLADDIKLPGPFTSTIASIKDLIIKFRAALTGEHIRVALRFPVDHDVRKLFVNAAVKKYIEYLMTAKKVVPFPYQAEIDKYDAFAADLMRECGKAFAQKTISPRDKKYITIDPLVGERGPKIMISVFPK